MLSRTRWVISSATHWVPRTVRSRPPNGAVTCNTTKVLPRWFRYVYSRYVCRRSGRSPYPPGVRIALVGQMGHSSANAQSSKSPQFKPAKPGGFAGRAARSAEGDGWGREGIARHTAWGHQPAPRLSTGYSSPGALGVRPIVAVGKGGAVAERDAIMLGAGWGTSRPREWHGTPPRAPVPRVRQHCKAARGEPSTSSATVLPRSGAKVFIAAIKQPDGRCKVARGASVGME